MERDEERQTEYKDRRNRETAGIERHTESAEIERDKDRQTEQRQTDRQSVTEWYRRKRERQRDRRNRETKRMHLEVFHSQSWHHRNVTARTDFFQQERKEESLWQGHLVNCRETLRKQFMQP